MKYGPLQYALKSQRWLGFPLTIMLRNQWCSGVYKLLQLFAQLGDICTTGLQHGSCRLIVQQGQKQVFYRHKFMTFRASILKCIIQCLL